LIHIWVKMCNFWLFWSWFISYDMMTSSCIHFPERTFLSILWLNNNCINTA
jgi:hypothetical protein